MHENGICFITENDLSDEEAEMLAEQLDLYRKKRTKYEERQKRHLAHLQQLLTDLTNKLPKMQQKDIEQWAIQEVKEELTSSDFGESFLKRFKIVPDHEEILQKILQRLTDIQNKEVEALKKRCMNKDTQTIDKITSQAIGLPFSHAGFSGKFAVKYYSASNRTDFFTAINDQIAKNIAAKKEAERRAAEAKREAERRAAEARRAAAERARQAEAQRRAELAKQYYPELLNEFVVTANSFDGSCTDTFLKRVINHREKALFIQNSIQCSKAQNDFFNCVALSGLFAENHFKYLQLASRYTDLYQFNNSERCIQEAEDAGKSSVKYFRQAINAYNNL